MLLPNLLQPLEAPHQVPHPWQLTIRSVFRSRSVGLVGKPLTRRLVAGVPGFAKTVVVEAKLRPRDESGEPCGEVRVIGTPVKIEDVRRSLTVKVDQRAGNLNQAHGETGERRYLGF